MSELDSRQISLEFREEKKLQELEDETDHELVGEFKRPCCGDSMFIVGLED